MRTFEQPAPIHLPTVLAGREMAFRAFRWAVGKTPVATIVPRDRSSGRSALALPMPAGITSLFHIANVFEEGDKLIMDAVASYGPPEASASFPRRLREELGIALAPDYEAALIRCVIDLVARSVEVKAIPGGRGELPTIHRGYSGRPHRHVYLLSPGSDGREPAPNMPLWFHEIARVDVETGERQAWHAGPASFCSEPAFAPRVGSTAEDDGYVLTWVLDAQRGQTDVVILDARALGAGLVARLHLGCHLPAASHSRFEPELQLGA